MTLTNYSFSAPDVALVVSFSPPSAPAPGVLTYTTADEDIILEDSFVNSANTFTTLSAALTAAQAINPDFNGNELFTPPELTPDEVSAEILRPEVGTSVTLSALFTSNKPGTTFEYSWYKEVNGAWLLINGATSSTITTNSFTAAMRGTYQCRIVATYSAEATTAGEFVGVRVLEPLPYLDASDAIGGTDPYGSINTGRGDYTGGGDPDDLNFTYVTLIDPTYVQADLELYVPTTNTTIPYVTNLPAPYHFDSNGACFNGTDYEIQIRVAATSLVIGEVTVPGPQATNDEIYFWAP